MKNKLLKKLGYTAIALGIAVPLNVGVLGAMNSFADNNTEVSTNNIKKDANEKTFDLKVINKNSEEPIVGIKIKIASKDSSGNEVTNFIGRTNSKGELDKANADSDYKDNALEDGGVMLDADNTDYYYKLADISTSDKHSFTLVDDITDETLKLEVENEVFYQDEDFKAYSKDYVKVNIVQSLQDGASKSNVAYSVYQNGEKLNGAFFVQNGKAQIEGNGKYDGSSRVIVKDGYFYFKKISGASYSINATTTSGYKSVPTKYDVDLTVKPISTGTSQDTDFIIKKANELSGLDFKLIDKNNKALSGINIKVYSNSKTYFQGKTDSYGRLNKSNATIGSDLLSGTNLKLAPGTYYYRLADVKDSTQHKFIVKAGEFNAQTLKLNVDGSSSSSKSSTLAKTGVQDTTMYSAAGLGVIVLGFMMLRRR